ncbi:hypothetical protein QQS21_005613 [Conoideocrella luteorostrata]|uniref:Leptomycin B resistance protein pmd1 n=1 Tax=Conoideocrella luteorostrata TaxID=1105319 RepID=A0AAJ0CP56_9HYPO|nr:hypothetical protein QQS21_005613 [Conoideocrella luteorostrata]
MADSKPPARDATSKVSEKLRNIFAYFSIYVRANPTKLDIALFVTGLISACASGVPFPILGIIFGQLIDDFNDESCDAGASSSLDPLRQAAYQSAVNDKILYVVYLAVAQFVLVYIHLVCWSLGGARLAQRLREQYLQKLLHQDPAFFDNVPSGEVSSRLNGDISAIRAGTSEKVGILLSSVSFFVTAYVVAFIKNSKLAGILIVLIPAYFTMSLVGAWFIEKYSSRVSDHFAAASSIASEALSNVAVVHAFNANDRLEAKFSRHLRAARNVGLKKAVANGVQAGLMYFIAYSANGLSFWLGSRMIADNVENNVSGVTVGSIFTVIFLLVDATLILSEVTPFIHIFAAAAASFSKIRKDMEHLPVIDATSDNGIKLPAAASGHFELKGVCFTYPSRPEQQVLRNVSMELSAGKKTALVGFSGSGKSTVAALMLRLYDPAEGTVFLDGHDLRELNTRQVRSMIGLVQQESRLLDRSILENVAHGLVNSFSPDHERLHSVLLGPKLAEVAASIRGGKEADDVATQHGNNVADIVSLVQRAVELADAAQFIKRLPEGLGTVVGSSGKQLSGGQRQRIAIARALVKDPKILILDEATASLDSKSEREILAAIERCSSNRTVISVAHRLSTIQNADRIIVMSEGQVVEEGSHSDLIRRKGTYAGFVDLQNLSNPSAPHDGAASVENMSIDTRVEDDKQDVKTASEKILDVPSHDQSLSDVNGPSKQKPSWAPAKTLFSFVRPHVIIALIALVGASIVGGAFSAEAVIFGHTVGSLTPCQTPSYIKSSGNFFGLMFFVLAIIEFFANLTSWVGFGMVSEKSIYNIRVQLLRSLFQQDVQWHQSDDRTPTSLLGYITNDGNQIAGLSGSTIGTILSICINLLAAIIMTLVVAWKIAIVCLAVVPLLLGIGLIQLRTLGKFYEKHEDAFSKSVGISVEAVDSIKTVASLSLEGEILEVYRRTLDGPKREVTAISFTANLWLALQYLTGNLAFGLAFWWGSKQIFNGLYTQTQFIIVVFSLLVSAQLWSQMFALAPEFTNAKAAIARVTQVIELGKPEHSNASASTKNDVEAIAETKNISPKPRGGVDLELRNVHFSYPTRFNAPALTGLNLRVRPGQFCGLVGPSGAGKSTIISLVERMYVPSSGEILIDGSDITKKTDITFRDDIALVPQDGVLFEGSVRFNVSLGARPGTEVSEEEIIQACKLANIHDTIMSLPEGYDTDCGSSGNKLSGGQKQRLAIARALVRKPRLLILDEPTSALDAESEKLLQNGLEIASKGISVLAVAHRLHTIRKADIIYMIEGGRAVDSGTHDELYARSENYRSNVLSQMISG